MPSRATCLPAPAPTSFSSSPAPSPWDRPPSHDTCRLDSPVAVEPELETLSAAGLFDPAATPAGAAAASPPSAPMGPNAGLAPPAEQSAGGEPAWAADIPSRARAPVAGPGFTARTERFDWHDRSYGPTHARPESALTARLGPAGGEVRQRFPSGASGGLDPDLAFSADRRGTTFGMGLNGTADDGDWRVGFGFGTSARANHERRWQTDDGRNGSSSTGIELDLRGLNASDRRRSTSRMDFARGTRQIEATAESHDSANLDIRTEPPVRYDDPPGYRVRYRMIVDASTAGSLTGQLNRMRPEQGGSVIAVTPMFGLGVHGSFTGNVTIEGVRNFPDQRSANAFYNLPDIGTLLDVPTSASAAQAVPVGETRRISGALGLQGGVHGGVAMVTAAASRGTQIGQAIQVERESERWTVVTIERSSSDSASVDLSGPLLGLSGSDTDGQTQARSYRIDLDTPAGEEAYNLILAGMEPEFSDAVQPAGTVDEQTNHRGFIARAPLVQFSGGQVQRSRRETHADGSRVETDEGSREQSVEWWRWMQDWLPAGFGGRGLLSSTEYCPEDEETASHVASITRSKGQDVQTTWRMLNELEGAPELTPRDRGKGEAGEWSLSRDWGPESLDDLVRRAWSVPGHRLDWQTGDRAQLFRALRAADGDRAAQRAAVQAYGSGNANARSELQTILGRQPERYLGLEGSSVWIGARGWRGAEARLRADSQELESQPKAAADNLRELRDAHTARLESLQDWSRFAEVPQALRRLEINRTRAFLDRIDLALATAGAPQIPGEHGGLFQALLADVTAARESMQARYDALIALETRHGVGRLGNGRSLWERHGGTGAVDARAAADYAEAERLKREGEAMRRVGVERAAVGRVRLRQGLPDEAEQSLMAAIHDYSSAEVRFDEAAGCLHHVEHQGPKPWIQSDR